MSKKITNFPVMPAKCSTCPFRVNDHGRHVDPMTVSRIQADVISKASQICHHPTLSGKKETHLCRGARDYQIEIFYRLGFLESRTDEAWQKRLQELKSKKEQSLNKDLV